MPLNFSNSNLIFYFKIKDQLIPRIPLGRLGDPVEIAEVAAFLGLLLIHVVEKHHFSYYLYFYYSLLSGWFLRKKILYDIKLPDIFRDKTMGDIG